MIGLGIWQLQRAHGRKALLAQYAAGREAAADHLADGAAARRPAAACSAMRPASACGVVGQRAVAGENRAGEPGYVHIVDCATGAEGPGMSVEVGWSKDPEREGELGGRPGQRDHRARPRTRMRLVAASAPPGLEPSAPPSLDIDPQQPSVLRAAMVQLRCNRADHLWARGAQAAEESEPRP